MIQTTDKDQRTLNKSICDIYKQNIPINYLECDLIKQNYYKNFLTPKVNINHTKPITTLTSVI